MKHRIRISFSLLLVAMTLLPVTTLAKTCGVSIQWCVFTNRTVNPHVLGVAKGTYHEPGWEYLRGPWLEPWKAWREACKWHDRAPYHSPDIAAGRIDCAACAQGPDGCAR